MVRRKKLRSRGKLRFSEYFKRLNLGEKVSISKEKSVKASFPERMQGKTGTVEEKRGKSYVIKVKDKNRDKKFIVNPIHLKKIKT